MPINLSNLSTEDIATATTAIESAWVIHKERMCCETEARRLREEVEAQTAVEAKKEAE
jgi:hypothetical protein